MLTTVQLACIVTSKSGAPLANFGPQMSTGALLFPTLHSYIIIILLRMGKRVSNGFEIIITNTTCLVSEFPIT